MMVMRLPGGERMEALFLPWLDLTVFGGWIVAFCIVEYEPKTMKEQGPRHRNQLNHPNPYANTIKCIRDSRFYQTIVQAVFPTPKQANDGIESDPVAAAADRAVMSS
jgi:hypothetical protein